jgi:hypothetical protein
MASKTDVADAPSGFRAISREAAMRLNVFNAYTYTLETIIQAGNKNLALAHLPVATNAPTRPSRLFRGARQYVWRSAATIIRIYAMYQPLRFFLTLGGLLTAVGLLVSMRFLWFFVTEGGAGHVQSLILAAVLVIVGFQVMLIGLVADLITGHRRISEDILYRVKELELGLLNGPRRSWSERVVAEASRQEPSPRS